MVTHDPRAAAARQSRAAPREGTPRTGDSLMFRWLPLVWANLKRRKLRLVFTFMSIVLAFLMFGHDRCAAHQPVGWRERRPARTGSSCSSKVNITMPLPAVALRKGPGVAPGVRAAAPFNWFGGVYQGLARSRSRCRPRDPEDFLAVYPDFMLKPEETRRPGSATVRASSSAKSLAQQYGWKVGRAHSAPLADLAQGRTTATPGSSTSWAIYDVKDSVAGQARARSSITTTSTSRCCSARTRSARCRSASTIPRRPTQIGERHRRDVRQFAVRDQDGHRARFDQAASSSRSATSA